MQIFFYTVHLNESSSTSKRVTWRSMESPVQLFLTHELTIAALTNCTQIFTYICIYVLHECREANTPAYLNLALENSWCNAPMTKPHLPKSRIIWSVRYTIHTYIEIYRYSTLICLTYFFVIYSRFVFVLLRTHILTNTSSLLILTWRSLFCDVFQKLLLTKICI